MTTAGTPDRRVLGPVRSYAERLGEHVIGGLVQSLHGVLIKTGVLTPVPKWRGVPPARARLPLPPLAAGAVDVTGHRVAAGVAVQAAGAPPPAGCPSDAPGPALWITDPRTGLAMAYAIERDPDAFAAIAPGLPAAALAPEVRATLAALGGLAPADHAGEATAERAELAHALARDGFVVIPALVAPGLLASLRDHFLAQPRERRLETDLMSGRLVEKNEAVARHMLHGLTAFVAALAQRDVKPSYCFSMWYAAGARLRVHRDNALCEYTLNLVIDQQPARPEHWPLCMVSRRGRIEEVYLRPGDAVLFRGRELAHYRRRLRGQGTAIGVLWHYVHTDFPDLAAAGAYA